MSLHDIDTEKLAAHIASTLDYMHSIEGKSFEKIVQAPLKVTSMLADHPLIIAKGKDEPAISILSVLNTLLSVSGSNKRVYMEYEDSDPTDTQFNGFKVMEFEEKR